MKLSELVDRCHGSDPEIAIEDEHGILRPVVGFDTGEMETDGGSLTYVRLVPARVAYLPPAAGYRHDAGGPR